MFDLCQRQDAHDPLAGAKLCRHQIAGIAGVAAYFDTRRVTPRMVENSGADIAIMKNNVGARDTAHIAECQ